MRPAINFAAAPTLALLAFGVVVSTSPAGAALNDEASQEACWEVQFVSSQQLASSNVLWRVPSKFDSQANLYLTQSFADDPEFAVLKVTADTNPDWETAFHREEGARYLRFKDLVADSAGNVCVLGVSSTNFHTDTATAWVWKVNGTGAVLWSTQYVTAGFPHAIAVDTSDNIFVTGTTSEGISSAGTSKPAGSIEILKFGAGGQHLWTTNSGQSNNLRAEPGALATDANGSVYVAGKTFEALSNLILAKHDAAGNQRWLNRTSMFQMYPPNSVLVDNQGNLIVGLSFWHGAPFDSYATYKYDTNGNIMWTVSLDEYSEIGVRPAWALDQFNNIYLATVRAGDWVLRCVKYDPQGNLLWSLTGDFPFARYSPLSLRVNTLQEIAVAGWTETGGLAVLKYRQNNVPGRPIIHGAVPRRRVVKGAAVTFNLPVTGTQPLYYQWRRDRIDLPGATNASLVLSNVTTSDSGNYSVVVTNSIGCAVSAEGLLTVVDLQPFHFENPRKTNSNMTVHFIGEASRVYWFETSTNLTDWSEMFGSSSSSSNRDLIFSDGGSPLRFFRVKTYP